MSYHFGSVNTLLKLHQVTLKNISQPNESNPAGVIKPGSVGEDGKIKEMDIAEQIAKVQIPEGDGSSDEEEEDLKLDTNHFFPRKKPT